MAKSTIFLALVVLTVCVNLSYQQCPPSSKVTQCSPRCVEDTTCATMGGKCCPNLCNYKSCVLPRGSNAANNDKYSSSGAGSYCGNIKCNSYEKCELDRSTKRQKCVRT